MTSLRSTRIHTTIRALTVTLLAIAIFINNQAAVASEEGVKPTDATNPLAPFAKLMSGEWRLKMQSENLMFTRWHWGPGHHSVFSQTYGSDGGGNPWRSLEVFYYCPKRRQIRTLGLSPDIPGLGRSVSEGHITFDGKTAYGDSEMHQPGHPGRGVRTFKTRWVFDGDDTFRSRLQEHDGKSLFTLGEWESRRSLTLSPMPAVVAKSIEPDGELSFFRSIVGTAWESIVTKDRSNRRKFETTFTWIPYVNAIYICTFAVDGGNNVQHMMDGYVYYHVGKKQLRGLALMDNGTVFEGTVSVLKDKNLVVGDFLDSGGEKHQVQFDLSNDSKVQEQIWFVDERGRRILWQPIVHRRKIQKKSEI